MGPRGIEGDLIIVGRIYARDIASQKPKHGGCLGYREVDIGNEKLAWL